MLIQLYTSVKLRKDARLSHYIRTTLRKVMAPHRETITRIEVHLKDDVIHKNEQNDKNCVIEVRLSGLKPMVVKANGTSLHEVFTHATEKLYHIVTNTRGKTRGRRHILRHPFLS